MKRKIFVLAILAALPATLLFNGCKKNDTTPPVITLKGSNPDTWQLNGGAYSDPGATANDDNDGSVSVSSTFSSTNPDVTTSGSYTITYTASDKAGNSQTASRIVNIVIGRANYVWSGYSATDSSRATGYFGYTGNITAGSASDQIIISNFSGTTQNCIATVSGGTLTIPSQTVGAFTIIGGGTMNNKGNTLNLLYYSTFNSVTDTLVSVMTKQ